MINPPVRTLYSLPCANRGVGMTCRSILRAATVAGYRTDLFTPRAVNAGAEPFALRGRLPFVIRRLPYGLFRPAIDRHTHARFLAALDDGDIAYLWPSVPLQVYETLAARGISIVAEAVNTLMSVSKPILDAAFDRLGLPPGHGITETRIADQMQRFQLCSAVFVPNDATERALAGTGLQDRCIGAGYGTWVPENLPEQPPHAPGKPVTFLFVGTASVRKGMPQLLEAWRHAPPLAHLRIVGPVEPAIALLFADVLNSDNVSCAGYLRDVSAEYARADAAILMSLEEGDPIATYEAAAHALPIIASEAGAGRIGAETDTIDIVDPADTAALGAKIAELTASEELRRHKGRRIGQAAQAYDWSQVGPRRFARLMEKLGNKVA